MISTSKLYAALEGRCVRRSITWRQAAQEIGISASTLTRLASGSSIDLEGFGKCVHWLGCSADEFFTSPRPHEPERSLEVVFATAIQDSSLSNIAKAALRSMVLVALSGVRALDEE